MYFDVQQGDHRSVQSILDAIKTLRIADWYPGLDRMKARIQAPEGFTISSYFRRVADQIAEMTNIGFFHPTWLMFDNQIGLALTLRLYKSLVFPEKQIFDLPRNGTHDELASQPPYAEHFKDTEQIIIEQRLSKHHPHRANREKSPFLFSANNEFDAESWFLTVAPMVRINLWKEEKLAASKQGPFVFSRAFETLSGKPLPIQTNSYRRTSVRTKVGDVTWVLSKDWKEAACSGYINVIENGKSRRFRDCD